MIPVTIRKPLLSGLEKGHLEVHAHDARDQGQGAQQHGNEGQHAHGLVGLLRRAHRQQLEGADHQFAGVVDVVLGALEPGVQRDEMRPVSGFSVAMKSGRARP